MVGHITSGAYGHTLGGAVGLGYVSAEPGLGCRVGARMARYEVEVACERVAAEVSLRPLYDPEIQKSAVNSYGNAGTFRLERGPDQARTLRCPLATHAAIIRGLSSSDCSSVASLMALLTSALGALHKSSVINRIGNLARTLRVDLWLNMAGHIVRQDIIPGADGIVERQRFV